MIANKLITPEDYQSEAITKVRNHLLSYIEVNDTSKVDEVLLQSTVASGKTVMGGLIMESLLEHLNRDKGKYNNTDVCFIWTSTSSGGLLEQSKESVDSFTGKGLNVIDLQTAINKRKLSPGDALFLGWESVRSDKNIVRRDNEIGNIDEILNDTDAKIILIIDESHRDKEGEQSIKVVEDLIKPFAILNLTATPSYTNQQGDVVRVDPQRVIDSGRIRRRVKINEDIVESEDNISYKSKVLATAIKKRAEIIEFAQERAIADYKIQKPLILVQIANDKSTQAEENMQLEQTMELLLENGIDGDKIAINLSGEKKLFDDIDDNDAEVLIMKQAISTGWDCPRAQILVQFREVGSVVFHLQTLGRIMRTLKGVHYGYDLLDNAYLYTDSEEIDISIDNEMANATGLTRDSAKLRYEFIEDIGLFEIPMQKVVFEKLGEIDSEYLWESLGREINLESLNVESLEDVYTIKGGSQDIESGDVLTGKDIDLSSECGKSHTLIDSELSDEFIRGVGNRLKNYDLKIMVKFILSKHPKCLEFEDKNDFIHRLYFKNKTEIDRVIGNVVKSFKEMQSEKQLEDIPYIIQEEIFRAGLKEGATSKYAYDREGEVDSRSESEGPFVGTLRNRDEIKYWFMNQLSDDDFSIVYFDKDRRPHQYHPDFFIIDEDNRLFIVDVKSKHGDKEYENTKEKYEAGKIFENQLNNVDTRFDDIIFSMIRLNEDLEPTILRGLRYQEEFTSNWVDFVAVLKGEIEAR